MENRIYTNLELKSFEYELTPYWETRTLTAGAPVKICNYNLYMKDKKILRWYPDTKDWAIAGDRIKDYMEVQEKIDQLGKLKGRRDYAKKKQSEDFEGETV